MNIHMQVRSPELLRQHEARKARLARFAGAANRAATRVAPQPQQQVLTTTCAPAPVAPEGDWADAIIDAVCEHYGLKPCDVIGVGRTWKVVRPRHVAMYLAHTLTENSLAVIGRAIGGRDATTVHHGARQIEYIIKSEPKIAADVEALRLKLIGGFDEHKS